MEEKVRLTRIEMEDRFQVHGDLKENKPTDPC